MTIEDGVYLIHSCNENTRNYYPSADYDGQQMATISGASTAAPTEWQVNWHSSSNTYTITKKGSRGTWAHSKTKIGDDIVVYTSNPSGWSHHWRFIEIGTRTKDLAIVAIASSQSPEGGNLFVEVDGNERLKLDWRQGSPVHGWIPQWRLIKQ